MPFLKNNHHNLFENKPLQFNNFICKDCSAKKKEYEYFKRYQTRTIQYSNE